MEIKQLSEINGNPKNPRTMSKHDAASLRAAILEFGDLSGVVFNTRTQQLVGGHQRIATFKQMDGDKKIVLTQHFEPASKVGTTALGYVQLGAEYFGYREVDWPADREIAANIAANRIAGDWDLDLLNEHNQWLAENNPDLLKKTGQTDAEISRLMGDGPADDDEQKDGRQSLSCKLNDDQFAVVERAIQTMKTQRSFADEPNPDFDGNAIFYICNEWLATHG